MEHENDGDTNCNWCALCSHPRTGTGTGGLGNKRTSGDHPNYGIKIGQIPEKSPGDLRRLEETCCHSDSSDKSSAITGVKISQKRIIIIIIITIIIIVIVFSHQQTLMVFYWSLSDSKSF